MSWPGLLADTLSCVTGDLQRRIAVYDFDADAEPGRFVAKLADDNGWDKTYASKVVAEYRRYAYLACAAGHEVVPSDSVDMAWHQHLLDTQAYWDDFCPNVLQKTLHHRPGKGDDDERHRYYYDLTLLTYANTFGSAPPADIWSATADRFGKDLRQRRVSLHRNWVIPKRLVWVVAAILGVVAGIIVMSLVERSGVVARLFLLNVAAVGLSIWLLRSLIRREQAAALRAEESPGIDPYEAAILAHDSRAAINVAVAALVCDNSLSFDDRALTREKDKYRLLPTGTVRARAHTLEHAVYDTVARSDSGVLLRDVHKKGAHLTKGCQSALLTHGLLVNQPPFLFRLACVLPVIVAIVVDIHVATTRGIGLAGTVAFFTAVALVGLVIGPRSPSVTDRGTAALNNRRIGHTFTDRIERHDVRSGHELSWILALQGTAALAGGSFAVLYEAITAPAQLGGGAENTGGSGCSGGCGGCGGCG